MRENKIIIAPSHPEDSQRGSSGGGDTHGGGGSGSGRSEGSWAAMWAVVAARPYLLLQAPGDVQVRLQLIAWTSTPKDLFERILKHATRLPC